MLVLCDRLRSLVLSRWCWSLQCPDDVRTHAWTRIIYSTLFSFRWWYSSVCVYVLRIWTIKRDALITWNTTIRIFFPSANETANTIFTFRGMLLPAIKLLGTEGTNTWKLPLTQTHFKPFLWFVLCWSNALGGSSSSSSSNGIYIRWATIEIVWRDKWYRCGWTVTPIKGAKS